MKGTDFNDFMSVQILALERAADKKLITWSVKVNGSLIEHHPANSLRFHQFSQNVLNEAIVDSVKRLMLPTIKRRIR